MASMKMEPTRGGRRILPVTAVLGTVSLALAGCSAEGPSANGEEPSGGGTVTLMATWTGAEQDSLMAMLEPWEEETGITVHYVGTQDLAAQLTTGVASGNLPDVSTLPLGNMEDWYQQGALQPLDFIDLDSYAASVPDGFVELGQADDGTLIGLFTKASVKGLVYYNTSAFSANAPATWDDLVALGDQSGISTWCIGLESGGNSGWPGTDWIEDIVLRQSGPDIYDSWVAGELAWTSPEISTAWRTFGQALDSAYGGPDYVVNTNFGTAANPMFDEEPGCLFHKQASFITDFFKNEAGAGEGDYDFFPFPDIVPEYGNSVTGSGDLFGMFNDTPEARSLIEYLLTPEAQEIWVKRGGFISGNPAIPSESYPDDASRKAAEILSTARIFRFDGSELMPPEMTSAFGRAIVTFAADQSKLDSVLAELDQVRIDAYEN